MPRPRGGGVAGGSSCSNQPVNYDMNINGRQLTTWPLLDRKVVDIDVIRGTTSTSTTTASITSPSSPSTSTSTSEIVVEGCREASTTALLVTSSHVYEYKIEIARRYNDTDEQAQHRRCFSVRRVEQDYQCNRKDKRESVEDPSSSGRVSLRQLSCRQTQTPESRQSLPSPRPQALDTLPGRCCGSQPPHSPPPRSTTLLPSFLLVFLLLTFQTQQCSRNRYSTTRSTSRAWCTDWRRRLRTRLGLTKFSGPPHPLPYGFALGELCRYV